MFIIQKILIFYHQKGLWLHMLYCLRLTGFVVKINTWMIKNKLINNYFQTYNESENKATSFKLKCHLKLGSCVVE